MKHISIVYLLALVPLISPTISYSRMRTNETTTTRSMPTENSDVLSIDNSDIGDDEDVNKKLCDKHKSCNHSTPINCLPYTITRSGAYCLTKDFPYFGSGSAITINADNVTLNLANHSLTVNGATTTGISVLGSNVTIENGILNHTLQTTDSSIGIYIANTSNVRVTNDAINGFNDGVLINNSNNVNVDGSYFENGFNGVYANPGVGVTISSSSFNNNAQGIFLDGGSRDVQILNVRETNASLGSYARWVTGLLIEDSIFSIDDSGNLDSCIQFGSGVVDEAIAQDIVIKDSQFLNVSPNQPAGFDGLLCVKGGNMIIEDSIITIDSAMVYTTTFSQEYRNGALHMSNTISAGLPDKIFTNVLITKSSISNGSGIAVVTENGTSGLTIENSMINSSLVGINLIGCNNCVIKSNEILNNTGDGIAVTGSNLLLPIVPSSSNSIEYNTISDNYNGINLTSSSNNNSVIYNNVFGNSAIGITNKGTNNRVYYNVSFNNTGANYSGVPLKVVNAPGTPMLVGSNITG